MDRRTDFECLHRRGLLISSCAQAFRSAFDSLRDLSVRENARRSRLGRGLAAERAGPAVRVTTRVVLSRLLPVWLPIGSRLLPVCPLHLFRCIFAQRVDLVCFLSQLFPHLTTDNRGGWCSREASKSVGSKEPASTIERPNGSLEHPPTVQTNDGLAV